MLRHIRRRRVTLAYLAASLAMLPATLPLGSCGTGIPDDNEPEKHFSAMSGEEEEALKRVRLYIDAAEKLDADKRIPEEVRAELRASIKTTRDALAEFIRLRQRGSARAQTLDGIGIAAVGILSDDTTGIGVANNFLLIGLGMAAMATIIFTNSPANRDHLAQVWHGVGEKLDQLGAMVMAMGSAAEDLADDVLSSAPALAPAVARPRIGDLLDKLPKTPANTNTAKPPAPPTAGTSIAPLPAPRTRPKPDEERDECKPEPWCPHKGQDTWHNKCADDIVGNVYPGCDVMVNGKRFDALQNRTLYEVKTDNYSTYKEIVKGWVLPAHEKTARSEYRLATECGFTFRFVVADLELFRILEKRLENLQEPIMQYEPKCSRQNMP